MQKHLGNGAQLTRAGASFLQGLDTSDTHLRAQQLGLQEARYGHDVTKYGHDVQAHLGGLQRQIQLAQLQREQNKDSLKATDDGIERSPLVMSNINGVATPDKEKMARLKQFYGKVGFHTMDPAAQENANAQFGLSEAVRNHLGGAAGGVAPPPGAINIVGVRDAELADVTKGRGLARGLFGPISPGNYGKSVVLNVNGVEQAVPADLFEGDNLAYVNKALEKLKQKPLSPHHITGGR